MGPHPLNGAQTHPEWLAQQTRSCPPEQPDSTGASEMSSPLMVTSSPRVKRVVIPPSCRDNIMADLHGSHASINKAMDLARTCVYWPSMEADITNYIKRCLTCIKSSNLPVEMLQPHEVPPRPWVKIGVDFFQDHLGKKHLIVADYFSKFSYMFLVASTHHSKTINHLRELFAAEGIPHHCHV